MHICVSKLFIIGSDNGLSPGRHQTITWTNAGILLIQDLFQGNLLKRNSYIFIRENPFENVLYEMAVILFQPQCVKLLSGKHHRTSLLSRQHWFRYRLNAFRQQPIIWANVDPKLCHHMASLSLNQFMFLNAFLTPKLTKLGTHVFKKTCSKSIQKASIRLLYLKCMFQWQWISMTSFISMSRNDFPLQNYIDGLVQERRNSIAWAMELRLSCTNPSISHFSSAR